MKGIIKDFNRFNSSKRKYRKNTGPRLNVAGDLTTKPMEKAKALDAFFASVFTAKIDLQESQTPENNGGDWCKDLPSC